MLTIQLGPSGGFWLSKYWRFENHWLLLSKKRRAQSTLAMNATGRCRRGDPAILTQPLPPGVSQATCCFQFRFCLFCSGHGSSSWALYHTPQPSPDLRWRNAPALPLPYPWHDVTFHAPMPGSLSLPLSGHIAAVLRKQMQAQPLTQTFHFPGGNAISTARACVPALCVIISHALSFS